MLNHELSTPLVNILINANLLQEAIHEGQPSENFDRYLNVILNSGQHQQQQQVIQRMLDTPKMEYGKLPSVYGGARRATGLKKPALSLSKGQCWKEETTQRRLFTAARVGATLRLLE